MALFKPFKGNRGSLDNVPLTAGHAYFCVDDGSFHIDYKDAEGKVVRKQLNAKDAETLAGMSLDELKAQLLIQSDWTQNDSTAPDYIKNRPFYDGEIIVEVVNGEYTSEAQNDLMGLYGISIQYSENIKLPAAVDVRLDGESYLNLALTYIEELGVYCVGNLSYLSAFGLTYENTGEPFICMVGEVLCILVTDPTQNTTHSFVMSAHVDHTFKLDKKYLPTTVVTFDKMYGAIDNKITSFTYRIENINDTVTLRLSTTYDVDWGDGTIEEHNSSDPATHRYTHTGSFVVRIYLYNSEIAIPTRAFDSNAQLIKVVMGDNITSIEEDAFIGCENLTNVILGDGVKMIGKRAFMDCQKLTSIVIPDSVIFIDEFAFNKCKNLKEIALSDKMTSIAPHLFEYCDNLMQIVIPDSVTEISNYAFGECNSLTEIVIPDNVTKIGHGAFSNCSGLTEIVIPYNVVNISHNAFEDCDNLTSATFKNPIPIDNSFWFSGCTSLTYIYVPYGCKQAYVDRWTAYDVTQDIIDKIIESDREAMMSDVNSLKSEIQAELVGKTDYLGTVAAMADLSTIAGAGDYHRVSTEFVYDESTGEMAHVGDILIAVVDLVNYTDTQTKEYWDLVHTEMGAAPATSDDIANIFNEEA